MAGDTQIGGKCPSDGREWDCQCARCGSSMGVEDCWHCGGDGGPCIECDGEGTYPLCLSGTEWCEANPRPGREKIQRHTPEWFLVERGSDGG